MKKSDFYLFLILFVVLVGFAFLSGQKRLDPDFGWHLRTGQLILQKGIPKIDWYSYTMPNFPWIDHEWLADIFIYKTYSIFGNSLLLLIFLLFYFSSFFIAKRKEQKFKDMVLPIVLVCLGTFLFLGIRPQLLDVFFIAVMWVFLNNFFDNKSKLIYFLPLLFLVWANLHAGFFAGLFILALVVILELFKKIAKKISFFNFLSEFNLKEQPGSKILSIIYISFFSFIATLVNPYGLRLYQEVFRTVGDSFLKSNIGEWLPLFFSGNRAQFLYIAIFAGFAVIFYKKINFNNLIISLIFLVLAISSARYFLIFAVLSTSIFGEMIFLARQKIDPALLKEFFSSKNIWIAVVYIFLIICIFIGCFYDFYEGIVLPPGTGYPEKAVSFLKTLPLSENLFNFYDWGGYLIWKLPERKLFIDGRMPSWRQNKEFVFGDYISIEEAKSGFDKILKKYNVQLVLVPNTQKPDVETPQEEQKNEKIAEFSEKHKFLAYFFGVSPKNDLRQELVKLGWKDIYHDKTAVILEKK
jgi:hypothetical protein